MELLYENSLYKLKIKNENVTIILADDILRNSLVNKMFLSGINVIALSNTLYTNNLRDELKRLDLKDEVVKTLNCDRIIDADFKSLSMQDLAYVHIIIGLSKLPKVILLYDILTYLKKDDKDKVIEFLKQRNITIINFTSCEEEFLYCENMIIIDGNKVIMEGLTKEVLKNEKVIRRLGFNLPFVVDLSTQLKLYGVLDKYYYDTEELVDVLCKKVD